MEMPLRPKSLSSESNPSRTCSAGLRANVREYLLCFSSPFCHQPVTITKINYFSHRGIKVGLHVICTRHKASDLMS
jgi:hypothetical protein